MSGTCPNGHQSSASDYCDTCGAPMGDAAAAPSPNAPAPTAPTQSAPVQSAPAAAKPCPSCGNQSPPDALFCESCGYDFTTGAMPRPATPAPDLNLADLAADAAAQGQTPAPVAPSVAVEWVAEVWVDPDWYAEQDSEEQCPSPGLPVVVPLRVRSLLIGRTSRSRNIHPEIDCTDDVGVSRRQAQLSTDGTRWWVEDLQSSNGTYVGPASGPLPTAPLPPGQRQQLGEDDRVYVGAWTRIVVRRASAAERTL